MSAVCFDAAPIAPSAFGGWISFRFDDVEFGPRRPQYGIRLILSSVLPQQCYLEAVTVFDETAHASGDICYQLGAPGTVLSDEACATLNMPSGTVLCLQVASAIHEHLLATVGRLMRQDGLTGWLIAPAVLTEPPLPSVAEFSRPLAVVAECQAEAA